MQKTWKYEILGSPLGPKMLTFGQPGREIRPPFADMVPGRPRVPQKTSKSEVFGTISGGFW